jgi:dTDP-4-dehydrorhamnose reductase
MKILLLGKSGQVGWELQRALAPLGTLVALDRHSTDYCGDLSNLDGLRETLRALKPDVIVNAAAYTAVDKAEDDTLAANLINAEAVSVIANAAAECGALLVHYSTDYVFDGSGYQAWLESSAVSPVNAYGVSKLNGERAIVSSGCDHLIFRTSWVYGARGTNFAKTMLRLARERDTLNVIADQYGVPTGAELLADVTTLAVLKTISNRSLSGVYHLVPAGETTWHAYAQFVVDCALARGEHLAVASISPIPTSAYPTPAARPLNSRLDTRKLRTAFGLALPAWQDGVVRMLTEILDK